jgi:DNA-directed RNA polymerase specialized sigma24 family protein
LKELKEDLAGIHKTIRQSTAFSEQIEPVTILRPVEYAELSEQPASSVGGSTPGLRKEIEMLSNYGYEAKEIARQLNVSVGEVDLVLQLRENR